MKHLAAPVFALLLVALVAVAGEGLILAGVAVGAAVVISSVSTFGTRPTATAVLAVALLTAPMDDVRPGAASLVTVSDLCFVLGFTLLAPTMLRSRPHVPVGFAAGAGILLVTTLVSSALAADPKESLLLAARLVAAVIMLPLAYAWWAPSTRVIDLLAWSYVVGQMLSTVYAVIDGTTISGRYLGLTRHQNFFGIGATIAVALLLYLWTRTPRQHRWLVLVAGGVCLYGASLSGSRAAALAIVGIIVVYPLVERSLVTGYLVVVAVLAFVVSSSWLIDLLGPHSAIARLMPSHFGAGLSDRAREMALETYWASFLADPLIGEGYTEVQYTAHNVYLQIAVAIGIFGLAGFLTIGFSLVAPLLRGGPRHGLGYVALAYAAMAPVTPSVWDRNVWAGLGLAILATAPRRTTAPQRTTASRGTTAPRRRPGVQPRAGRDAVPLPSRTPRETEDVT